MYMYVHHVLYKTFVCDVMMTSFQMVCIDSQSVQQNGTWYLHVVLVKSGYPVDPDSIDYSRQAVVRTSRRKIILAAHSGNRSRKET